MSESVYEDDKTVVNRFESAVGRADGCPLGYTGNVTDPFRAGLTRDGVK